MKKSLTTVLAIAVVLAATNFAVAGGHGEQGRGHTGAQHRHNVSRGTHRHSHRYSNHSSHGYQPRYTHGYNRGRSFSHGRYYARNRFHWNYLSYSSKYGCDV